MCPSRPPQFPPSISWAFGGPRKLSGGAKRSHFGALLGPQEGTFGEVQKCNFVAEVQNLTLGVYLLILKPSIVRRLSNSDVLHMAVCP